MRHVERVVLDKGTARFDNIAHEFGEYVVSLGHIVDLDLKQRPRLGVERGFPELFGVHFAQPLVALKRKALFAFLQDRGEQVERAVDEL